MANTDTEAEDQDGQATADGEKKGFVKKLLGNKKLLIIVAAALLLVLGGGGAALYFFVFAAKEEPAKSASELPETPPQIVYCDMDEMIANIQSADGNPVYLKLEVALEVTSPEEKAGIEAMKPRIRDQFQAYLRELRPDDLKGSAGVLRIKEELVRRTNAVAAPYKIRDVLLKNMIIQ